MTHEDEGLRLVHLDNRRRVSLGKVGRPEHTRYIAYSEADGTIVLEPDALTQESRR